MTPEKFHDALSLLPSDLIEEADAVRGRRPGIIPLRRYAAMAASLALVLFCGALLTGRLLPRMEKATEQAACEMAPEEAAPKYDAARGEPGEQESGSTSGNSSIRAESTAEEPAATEQALCGLPTAPDAVEDALLFDLSLTECCSTPNNPDSSVNIYSVPQVLVLTSLEELHRYIEEHSAIYDLTELEAALPAYDESWFESSDLLLTVIHASHTGWKWTVSGIEDVRGIDEKGWDWFVLVSAVEQNSSAPVETNFHLLTPIEKGLMDPDSAILRVSDTHSPEPIQ